MGQLFAQPRKIACRLVERRGGEDDSAVEDRGGAVQGLLFASNTQSYMSPRGKPHATARIAARIGETWRRPLGWEAGSG